MKLITIQIHVKLTVEDARYNEALAALEVLTSDITKTAQTDAAAKVRAAIGLAPLDAALNDGSPTYVAPPPPDPEPEPAP